MAYDAVIIGAGPAGSHLGFLLAGAGCRVALVDRAVFPREKLCGGLLTRKTLDLLMGAYPDIRFSQYEIKEAHAFFQEERMGSFHLLSQSATVRRYNVDDILLREAQEKGADIFLGEALQLLDLKKHKVKLKSGRMLEFNFLIGADGALSRTRRLAKLPQNRLGFCMETAVPWDQIREPDRLLNGGIEIYYGTYPTGYGWVFPREDAVVIGVGNIASGMSEKEVAASFAAFFHQISFSENPHAHGAYLPDGSSIIWGTQDNGHFYLIGDAAGLIDPFTGEGIYYALLSAQITAEAILSPAFADSRYPQQTKVLSAQITDTLQMRGKLYSPTILHHAFVALQSLPSYGEKLIDETILRYTQSYREAYEEFQFYMR